MTQEEYKKALAAIREQEEIEYFKAMQRFFRAIAVIVILIIAAIVIL